MFAELPEANVRRWQVEHCEQLSKGNMFLDCGAGCNLSLKPWNDTINKYYLPAAPALASNVSPCVCLRVSFMGKSGPDETFYSGN